MENAAEAPEWERKLSEEVLFKDTERVLEAMTDTTRTQMCLDEVVKDRKGSFGTVIATEKEMLMEIKEAAFGDDPGSFGAEAHGILAGLRSLHRTRQRWETKVNKGMNMFCKNAGSLKRVENGIEGKINRPRKFLMVKAELEMLTVNVTKEMKKSAQFHHVKGHQDKGLSKEETEQLNWPTQMNMRCDEMAMEQLETQDVTGSYY